MLELITANLAGKVRREIFNGRQHWVAPVSMIVPGVLNGSQGPLFYPLEELERQPSAWNGIPIVLHHPEEGGRPVSARHPAVLNKFQLGTVFNTQVAGKLIAEAWFDVENTRRIAPRVLTSLEVEEPIELSTGLLLDTDPTPGEFNGVAYQAIARNYKPDHLAILPGMTGACSIKDGCGVLVNEDTEHNHKEADMAKTKDEQRKAIVDYVIANCECWEEGDRETLNGMTDDKLTALKTHVEKTKTAEAVANAARQGFEHGDVGFKFDEKELKFVGTSKAPPKKDPDPTTNKEADLPKKPLTDDEWLQSAPPGVQRVVRNAFKIEQDEKAKLIGVITANQANVFLKDQLQSMDVDALRGIAALAQQEEAKPPLYFGANVPATNRGKADEDDYLPLPTFNMDEQKKSA